MLYLLPIEPLEERYSKDWLEWFPRELINNDVMNYKIIHGTQLSKTIRQGAFLDVTDTNRYKATQIQTMMDLFDENDIKDGDIILLLDGWFPGVESLAYVRDALKINFKIASCFHAGSYDPEDRLFQWGCKKWAKHLENAWFKIYDLIFVATQFHKELMSDPFHYENEKEKIKVTGFPLYQTWELDFTIPRLDRVVFPHRLDPEKRPESFDKLTQEMSGTKIKFFKTKDHPDLDFESTKKGYYKAMQTAKVAISFAEQETWGIAMQEAVLCGCLPLVPNRLSYPELYLPEFVYTNDKQIPGMIEDFITNYEKYHSLLTAQRKMIRFRGDRAIANMVNEMQKLGVNL